MNNAKYVVLDGMDGCGKGTQMKFLQERFGESAVFTREPGGTPFAEEIRKIVRDNPLAGTSTSLNNFLLFWAAREDLQHNLIVPALQSGKHVFSDRGDSSTFAYQLCGEEHHEFFSMFMHIRQIVFAEVNSRRKPDLYIVFDLPAEAARERTLQDVSRTRNHFDIRDLKYYERVRKGFRRFAIYGPTVFIDATQMPEEIHGDVMLILAEKMNIP